MLSRLLYSRCSLVVYLSGILLASGVSLPGQETRRGPAGAVLPIHKGATALLVDIEKDIEAQRFDQVPQAIEKLLRMSDRSLPLLKVAGDKGLSRSREAAVIHFCRQLRKSDRPKYDEAVNAILASAKDASIDSREQAIAFLPDFEERGRLLAELGSLYVESQDYQRAEIVWLQNLERPRRVDFDESLRVQLQMSAARGLVTMWSKLGLHYDAQRLARQWGLPVPAETQKRLPAIRMPDAFRVDVTDHENHSYNSHLRQFCIGRSNANSLRTDVRTGKKYPEVPTVPRKQTPRKSLAMHWGNRKLLVFDQTRGVMSRVLENGSWSRQSALSHLATAVAQPAVIRAVSLLPDVSGDLWTRHLEPDPVTGTIAAFPIYHCGSRYICVSEPNRISTCDALDGRLHWTRDKSPGKTVQIAAADDFLVLNVDRNAQALVVETGAALTPTPIEEPLHLDVPLGDIEPHGRHVLVESLTDYARYQRQDFSRKRVRLFDYGTRGKPKQLMEFPDVRSLAVGPHRKLLVESHERGSRLRILNTTTGSLGDPVTIGDELSGVRCFEDDDRLYVWAVAADNKPALKAARRNSLPKWDYRAFHGGQIIALGKTTMQPAWSKQTRAFVDVTPLYPDLPFRVHFEAERPGRMYHLPWATEDYYTKYGIRILDARTGETVFEKKDVTDFVPELAYLDPAKKEMHFLCPTAEITVRMAWKAAQ